MYIYEINQIPLLPIDEIGRLARLTRNGDTDARDRIVQANLRLVVHIARKFAKGNSNLLQDLIQEGNVELLRVAKEFDPEMGTPFRIYATPCIEGAVKTALATRIRGAIRIPQQTRAKWAERDRIALELLDELGRSPTKQEIAQRLNVSLEMIDCITHANAVLKGHRQVDEQEHESEEQVSDLERHDQLTLVLQAIETLHRTQRTVLCKLFELDDQELRSVSDLAKERRVSCERIGQIKRKAIETIKKRLQAKGKTEAKIR